MPSALFTQEHQHLSTLCRNKMPHGAGQASYGVCFCHQGLMNSEEYQKTPEMARRRPVCDIVRGLWNDQQRQKKKNNGELGVANGGVKKEKDCRPQFSAALYLP